MGLRRFKYLELMFFEKKKNGFYLIFLIFIIEEIYLRFVLIDISVKKVLNEKE